MKRPVLAAVLSLAPGVALAEPQAFLCRMQADSSGGWIAPQIAFAIDLAAGRASVSDGIILAFTGGPMLAEIDSDTAARTVVKWTVRGKDSAQQSATMNYRATIMKADNSIAVSMRPLQYANSFRAEGTCQAQ